MLSAQKNKVIGVNQLIENSKYEEAKRILDDAIRDKSTRDWPRTWYTRGLLCQSAYTAGMKKKDKKLYELYNNQLYVAFNSFEKTRFLDKRGKYKRVLPSKYVLLANDFMTQAETYYQSENFGEAYRSYQYALQINTNKYVNIPLDTNLLYNTALCAYKSNKREEALEYLTELNSYKYSANVPHLMFVIYIMEADTMTALNIIKNGIDNYDDNQELNLILADLLYRQKKPDQSLDVLNEAYSKDSSNSIYLYNIGLFYQKDEDYKKAIGYFERALTLPSDTVKIYSGIGTCYYNMGANIDENARTIENNIKYLEEREKSFEDYNLALNWFEKAYEMDNSNQEIKDKLRQLYLILDKKEELHKLE